MSVAAASYQAVPAMVALQPKVVNPAQFIDALKKLSIPASQVILGADQTMRISNSLVVPEGHICTKQLHPLDVQRKVVVIAMPAQDFKTVFDLYAVQKKCPEIIKDMCTQLDGIKAEANAKMAQANAKIMAGNAKIVSGNAKIAEGLSKIDLSTQMRAEGAAMKAAGSAMVATADQQLTANALKRHQLLQQLALIKQQKLQMPPTAAAH